MEFVRKNWRGVGASLAVAVPAYLLGARLPTVGGPVLAILIGMVAALFWREKGSAASGIGFTSKYVLQTAVVLLGFGLNLGVVMETGLQSLPIIVCTISTSLLLAAVLKRALGVGGRTAALVGVGSSICGGSAIAATAPVIGAKGGEVAQAISVIFFYNVIAALVFPVFGQFLGMDTTTGEAFGIFAGTAINDTSSVTAAAATWDSMFGLGAETLDKAVTVKLTRTLAIIPITLVLALLMARRERGAEGFSLKRAFPMFVLYFALASLVTTIAMSCGVGAEAFAPLKELSKFLIVTAMAAIGLSSNLITLIKNSGKPLALGAACWAGITVVSLALQKVLGLW